MVYDITCNTCCLTLPKTAFSNRQYNGEYDGRNCKDCISKQHIRHNTHAQKHWMYITRKLCIRNGKNYNQSQFKFLINSLPRLPHLPPKEVASRWKVARWRMLEQKRHVEAQRVVGRYEGQWCDQNFCLHKCL